MRKELNATHTPYPQQVFTFIIITASEFKATTNAQIRKKLRASAPLKVQAMAISTAERCPVQYLKLKPVGAPRIIPTPRLRAESTEEKSIRKNSKHIISFLLILAPFHLSLIMEHTTAPVQHKIPMFPRFT
jgi:hypothetical protein